MVRRVGHGRTLIAGIRACLIVVKGRRPSQPTRGRKRRRGEPGGFIAEMGRVRTTEEEGMGKTVRGMKDHFWGKGEEGEREKAFHLMAER